MNYISEKLAQMRGKMAQKKMLILRLISGETHTFELTAKEIEKCINALENVEMQWFLVGGTRFRPSAIICIEVQ